MNGRAGAVVALAMLVAAPTRAADVPANGWVVWASDRTDGRLEIYLMKADGTDVARLTTKGGKFPGWSPDARWVAYTYPADGSTHVIRHNGSDDKKVCDGAFEFWLWDKSGLVCEVGDDHFRVNPDSGAKTLLFRKSDFPKVASKALNPGGITHDGRYLVAHSDLYRTGFTGDNGAFKAYNAAVILDFQDKGKVYFFGDGCEPNTPPSGDLIYHVCGEGPCATHPDPYQMNLKDIATRSSYKAEIAHADADWGHEYFPRISNDNAWMVYGATTGCHDHDTCDYEIHVHRLGAGSANRTRITNHTANDQWPHLYVGVLPSFGCTGASQHTASCTDAGVGPRPDAGAEAGSGSDSSTIDGGHAPAPIARLVGGCAVGGPGGSPVPLLLLLGLSLWLERRRGLRSRPRRQANLTDRRFGFRSHRFGRFCYRHAPAATCR